MKNYIKIGIIIVITCTGYFSFLDSIDASSYVFKNKEYDNILQQVYLPRTDDSLSRAARGYIGGFSGSNGSYNSSSKSFVDSYHAACYSGEIMQHYMDNGYTCTGNWAGTLCINEAFCVKNFYAYGATQNDYQTLTGYADRLFTAYANLTSPVIYMKNPPEGRISVYINSDLNRYYSKPVFNQDNGWNVEAEDGKMLIDGKEQSNLFYKLALSKLKINRSGKNFSSKEDLIGYLKNSDFLTKLGFSETEKKNSLDHFLAELDEIKDQKYYYLSILSDESISESSSLNINPKPEKIIRRYFAVYPTVVPVKTDGEFRFPEEEKNTDGFMIKETGEFLVRDSMQVFFE